MRPVRLLPAASAATALTLVVVAAGGATAATTTPAAGQVASTLSLLQLGAGGTEVEVGVVELLAETLSSPVAKVVVTPLVVDGVATGRQTVEGRRTTLPGLSTSAVAPALAGLLGVAGPELDVGAATTADSATSRATAGRLGSLELLGLPVALSGELSAVSQSNPAGALGEQSLVVEDLALPSVADLLTALGLDLSALPVEVLYELLDRLDLVTTTVEDLEEVLDAAKTAVQAQIDAAEAAVQDALDEVVGLTTQLTGTQSQLNTATSQLTGALAAVVPLQTARDAAQQQVTTANAQLTTATTQLTSATGALNSRLSLSGLTLAGYQALPEPLKAPLRPLIDPLIAGVTSAQAAVAAAQTAVTQATTALTGAVADLAAAEDLADAAQAAVDLLEGEIAALTTLIDAAQQLLDDAYAVLEQVLTVVSAETAALLGAVRAVLDETPLLSLDSLEVLTRTVVDSAAPGGQRAEVVGGRVAGLHVLGTDVLSDVLDVTEVDLLDLTTTQLTAVDALVGTLTGALSEVLSTVPLFPDLAVPAPQVDVLVADPSTGVVDGFGVASAIVQLLQVTLPPITLPLDLALPGAASLPVFGAGDLSALAVGDLVSQELSLGIGSLGPSARFRPAVSAAAPGGTPTPTPTPTAPGTGTTRPPTTTTTTSGRPLPATGAPALLGAAGLALLAGAALVRRRRDADLDDAAGLSDA